MLPWKMGERLPHVILDFQLNHLILLDNKTWNILSSVRTIGNLLSVAPMQHYLLWHTLICNPVQMASFPSAKVWAKRQISKRPWERPSYPTDTLQELQDLYNLRNWYQFFFFFFGINALTYNWENKLWTRVLNDLYFVFLLLFCNNNVHLWALILKLLHHWDMGKRTLFLKKPSQFHGSMNFTLVSLSLPMMSSNIGSNN